MERLDDAENAAEKRIELLKKKNKDNHIAESRLARIKSKRKGEVKTPETKLTDSMLKVIDRFAPDIENYLRQIKEKIEKFDKFIDISLERSEKIKDFTPKKGMLSVLRRRNSFTPIMAHDVQESKGGGDFLYLGGVSVTATRAKHDEVTDDQYALGFVFESKGVKVGFTCDTGWKMDESIAQPFKGCDVLVAHIGSIRSEEFDPKKPIEKRLYKNHLGILGLSGMLDIAKPQLCVISEFGEELGN